MDKEGSGIFLRVLTKKVLEGCHENLSVEERQPYAEVGKLSERVGIYHELPKDEQQILEDYFAKPT